MTNIYLTDSNEDILDFVKDHKELYYKTNAIEVWTDPKGWNIRTGYKISLDS